MNKMASSEDWEGYLIEEFREYCKRRIWVLKVCMLVGVSCICLHRLALLYFWTKQKEVLNGSS